jgi:hypothetical protein
MMTISMKLKPLCLFAEELIESNLALWKGNFFTKSQITFAHIWIEHDVLLI